MQDLETHRQDFFVYVYKGFTLKLTQKLGFPQLGDQILLECCYINNEVFYHVVI